MQNPFQLQGNWYKGNLHSHTTISDGLMIPKGLIYVYHKAGYQFLAITDHWKMTDVSEFKYGDFLVLSGIELTGGTANKYHIVGIGIDKEIAKENNKEYTLQECVSLIQNANGIAILAHPYWNGLVFNDYSNIDGIIALEVYNTGCDVEIARGYSEVHWDDILSSGRKINAIAVDDTHRAPFDILGGWVMVKAKSLTKVEIIDSLKNRLFYSSTGPDIYNIEINNKKIYVKCSPVKRIDLVSNPTLGDVLMARDGKSLTEAEFKINKCLKYIRIQIADFEGRKAWSNPFYFE